MHRYCVTALGKGTTLACGLRLVSAHWAGSEPVNTNLLEYQGRLLKPKEIS